MNVVYRIASGAGQHLRKRLQAMLLGFTLGARRSVYDGYILQAQALASGTYLAQAIDVPGSILLLGYQYRALGLSTLSPSLVLTAPLRDTLLSAQYFVDGGRLAALPADRTFINQLTQTALYNAAIADSSTVTPFSSADFIANLGVLSVSMKCAVGDTMAPWTKVTAAMPCDVELNLVNPLVSRITYATDGTSEVKGSDQARLSARRVLLGESFLRTFDSTALSVTRQSGVAYEGYWEDTTYAVSNIPRVQCVAGPRGTDDTGAYLDVVLAWSFYTHQQNIYDRYAQHNLAFVRLRLYADSVSIVDSAALLSSALGDYAPYLDSSQSTQPVYMLNRMLVNKMASFDDGTTVAISRYQRNRPGEVVDGNQTYQYHLGCLLSCFNAIGQVSREWLQTPVDYNAGDFYALYELFAYPLGLDTNGEDYGIAAVSSAGGYLAQRGEVLYDEAVLAIYAFDKTGSATQVTTHKGAYLATGQDPTTGAGERHVRYIGNGKFVIIAASGTVVAISGSTSVQRARDLRCYTFDKATGELTQTGIVDATFLPTSTRESANGYAYGVYSLGNLDVLVTQAGDADGTITRHAVLVLSRGGVGYRASVYNSDGSVAVPEDTAFAGSTGTTWISHDSGATWNVMADYGSGVGLYYTGNQLATRPFLGTQFS
ncbi:MULTISPECIES: hypothetical protein [unclassified Pseudomonas]|uniref:hypothetical protein n=1 Tax=unclassified Pseudomonas TaxID=196821 RepID=UPI00131D06DE|nr:MULTISPECIES: hypothetical protein [unclassified Pseudomonas]